MCGSLIKVCPGGFKKSLGLHLRRGERGGDGRSGPLWSPVPANSSSPMTESREAAAGRAGRATIKALPAPLHHPRPYEGTPREKDFSITLKFVHDDLSPPPISSIIAMAAKPPSLSHLYQFN